MDDKPRLKLIEAEFDIHRLKALLGINELQGQWFLSSTDDEISLVCESQNREQIKKDTAKSDLNWRAIKVEGPLDFSLTGIIAGLSHALAKAEIPVFVVSTFETDYLLVKDRNLAAALVALKKTGYVFV